MFCYSPAVDESILDSKFRVEFLLDNLRFDFNTLSPQPFSYHSSPVLQPLNQQNPLKAYRYNPGSFIQLEVSQMVLAGSKRKMLQVHLSFWLIVYFL